MSDLSTPEKLNAFWSALPGAPASFWKSELVSIGATVNRAIELERQAAEMRRFAEEETIELGRRMLAQARREWSESDVEAALGEVPA